MVISFPEKRETILVCPWLLFTIYYLTIREDREIGKKNKREREKTRNKVKKISKRN